MNWGRVNGFKGLIISSIFYLILPETIRNFAYSQTKPSRLPDTEGVLPKGKTPGPGKLINIEKPKLKMPNCYTYQANPFSGQLVYADLLNSLFLISKIESGAENDLVLLAFDILSAKTKRVVQFKAADGTAFTIHGVGEIEGISAFNFKNATFGCGNGVSRGHGIRIASSRLSLFESYQEGVYKIVPSDEQQPLVADMNTNILRLYAVKSLQSRAVMSFPPKTIPLFASIKNKSVYGVLIDQKSRILTRYDARLGQTTELVKFGPNMRVLNQGDQFALFQIDRNKAFVRFFSKFSQMPDGLYEFPLPTDLVSKSAFFDLDFKSKIGVMMAASYPDRRKVRRAFVVDGNKNRIISVVEPPKDYFVSAAMITFENGPIVFLHRHNDTDQLGLISFFDIDKRVLKNMQISYQ